MYNYDSYYKNHANQTLEWLPMDTKELYEHNLSKRYSDLLKYDWIDKKIEYKFNSHGFRCEEFTDEPSIMFLGCSHTIGIGLPIEDTWAHHVSKKTKLKCLNLGIGGGSADGAFRLCHGYIDKLKPKVVVLTTPPGIRFELVTATSIRNYLAASADVFYNLWAIDDNNHYFNQQKNILAINMLCKDRSIKFVIPDLIGLFKVNSLARDLAHTGVASNLHFSQIVTEMI